MTFILRLLFRSPGTTLVGAGLRVFEKARRQLERGIQLLKEEQQQNREEVLARQAQFEDFRAAMATKNAMLSGRIHEAAEALKYLPPALGR